MSLAGPTNYSSISMQVSAAYLAGHVLVAGMGNDGVQQTNYPAAYTAVIAVGAINPDKSFPNPNVDFCSPGFPGPTWGNHIDVVGPWFIGDFAEYGGQYSPNRYGGTSMAAATVSGVAALIRARNPTWPNWKVFHQLNITAEDIHTVGWDAQTGYGLVRAPLAVGFAPPAIVATIVNSKPRLTWSSVPLATDYVVYSKITPAICPNFQLIGTTTGTAYTDQSIQVTSFVGYDVAEPNYTAVSYQVFARSGGVVGQASQIATYKTTLSTPPC